MSRRIELQSHLSTAELYERYRACRRPNEKARRRALYLISRGTLAAEAARRVGRTSGWVTQLTRRYNEQARFKKKLRATAAALRRWHPSETVEVWGEDEARLGLKPILRRVWAPKGERPRSPHHPRYEWLWVFAAVHPLTGRVFRLVLPHLAAEMMQLFLDAFAAAHATPGKRVVLVVDGASAHRAKSLRVPERITLVGLPAYTPELNPTERLWPLVKEGVANRTHESLAALEEAVCGRCQRITAAQVTALTNYHWWPTV